MIKHLLGKEFHLKLFQETDKVYLKIFLAKLWAI